MTLKMKAGEGLTFDELTGAMDSRAIEETLKRLGPGQISKESAAKECESDFGREFRDSFQSEAVRYPTNDNPRPFHGWILGGIIRGPFSS